MLTSSVKIHSLAIIPLVLILGCGKFLEIDPPKAELAKSAVFENNSTANAAVLAIYSRMVNNYFSSYRIPLITGLSSDELTNYSTVNDISTFYSNSLNPNNLRITGDIWSPAYHIIFQANAIIEGVNDSNGLSINAKKQILGEALFIRAFWYFYLVNIFGDVPLITSTDYLENASKFRTPISDIYGQIKQDLLDAQELLNHNYIGGDGISVSTERVRPNKYTALALLARVYLYTGDYVSAEIISSQIINSGMYDLNTDLNSVFLLNSTEAIWQLQPRPGGVTPEGRGFILTGEPETLFDRSSTISETLLNSFEESDKRRESWVATYSLNNTPNFNYPYKYKVNNVSIGLNEYSMVFRLAEQYLIRAEARAFQNNISESITDLDQIRNRAGLKLILELNPNIGQQELLIAIEHERQIELFTEWGHRWFDIKRSGRMDEIMHQISQYKGVTWNTNFSLYPIPQIERNINSNLTQNPGYDF